jgi:EPS-associated MarR family transcriptional regulator
LVEISYKLLKLLEERPDISQRELARELGVSLGKTNYCMKALVDKGWVKVDNFRNSQNKLAYAYILTPKGVSEKAKVTLNFLQRKRSEFEAIRQEIEQLQREVQQSGEPPD